MATIKGRQQPLVESITLSTERFRLFINRRFIIHELANIAFIGLDVVSGQIFKIMTSD